MNPPTGTDLDWLIENLTWIHRSCGDQWASLRCIPVDREHFPSWRGSARPEPDMALLDLCSLLGIDRTRVSLTTFTDARDIQGMPLVIEGLPSNSYLKVDDLGHEGQHYVVELANSILEHPQVVLRETVLRFAEIVAVESGVPLEGPDLQQAAQLISLYVGFAPVWSSASGSVLYSTDGMWETKTRLADPLPLPMLVGALALLHTLKPEAVDLDLIPKGVAAEVRRFGPLGVDVAKEWETISRMRAGDTLQRQHRYTEAVEEYRKALSLADQTSDLALIHNNIGYAHTCAGEYELSFPSFLSALKLDPGFAYAMDNMGYALVMLGELEDAKGWLQRASMTDGNHPGYTHRNMALLLWKSGDLVAARAEFLKAFDGHDDVDLLEFHYARYLMEQGEPELALAYADRSAKKGEPAGIQLVQELTGK